MSLIKKSHILALFFILLSFNSSFAFCKIHCSKVRTFGDYAQIINPIVAAGISSQEKGLGHFGIIFIENTAIVHATKLLNNKTKFSIGKRPTIKGKKDRYDGFPSGHTNSAWFAASYVRTFSKDKKYLSIPLYISSIITGYSRVHAKQHTKTQVIAGAALAELTNYINSKMKWSNEYRSTNIYMGKNEASISLLFKF